MEVLNTQFSNGQNSLSNAAEPRMSIAAYPLKKWSFNFHNSVQWIDIGIDKSKTQRSKADLLKAAKILDEFSSLPMPGPLTLGPTQTDELSGEQKWAFAICGFLLISVVTRRPRRGHGEQIARKAIKEWLMHQLWVSPFDPEYATTLALFTEHIFDDLKQPNPCIRSWPVMSAGAISATDIVEADDSVVGASPSVSAPVAPMPGDLQASDFLVPFNGPIGVTAPEVTDINESASITIRSEPGNNIADSSELEFFHVRTQDFGAPVNVPSGETKPAPISFEIDSLLHSHEIKEPCVPSSMCTASEILTGRVELTSSLQDTVATPNIFESGELTKTESSSDESGPVIGAPRASITLPNSSHRQSHAQPDFEHIDREVTQNCKPLKLLWQQYRSSHSGNQTYQYSQFCKNYQRWLVALQKASTPTGENLEFTSTPPLGR